MERTQRYLRTEHTRTENGGKHGENDLLSQSDSKTTNLNKIKRVLKRDTLFTTLIEKNGRLKRKTKIRASSSLRIEVARHKQTPAPSDTSLLALRRTVSHNTPSQGEDEGPLRTV